MKIILYRLTFLSILIMLSKDAFPQKGVLIESGVTFSPSKSTNIQEKGLGYYPVEFDNFSGYFIGVGYERQLSYRSSIGILGKGTKLKTRYTLTMINPLDEIQPDVFNRYQFYGLQFDLYTLDAMLFYKWNYKKFDFQIGIGIPMLYKMNKINTYKDQTQFENVLYVYSNDSTAFLSTSNYHDLTLRTGERVTLNLGVSYKLDSKISLTLNLSDNILSGGSFQQTKISGYTLKDGFNDSNVAYPLNEINFKKKLTLLNLGIRYYFTNSNN